MHTCTGQCPPPFAFVPVSEDHHTTHARQVLPDATKQGEKWQIGEDEGIAAVIGDVGYVAVCQPRIQGVDDTANPHDAIPGACKAAAATAAARMLAGTSRG